MASGEAEGWAEGVGLGSAVGVADADGVGLATGVGLTVGLAVAVLPGVAAEPPASKAGGVDGALRLSPREQPASSRTKANTRAPTVISRLFMA